MDDATSSGTRRRKFYHGAARPLVADLDANSSHAKVLALIPADAVVLDVGCGGGDLASYLHARGNTVWGIDGNPDALASAAAYCAETRVADLDRETLPAIVGDQRFDVVIFADSLEHLREPWHTLQSARDVLAPGGTVVASIPNFAHAAVRLAVLGGILPYRSIGILDDTHLRWFTRPGVEALFGECGFRIEVTERTLIPMGSASNLVPDVRALHSGDALTEAVYDDPEAETLQFVVRAVPVPGPWDVDALRGYVHDLQARLDETTVGLRNVERASAADAARVAALGAERENLVRDVAQANRLAARLDDELRAAEQRADEAGRHADTLVAAIASLTAERDALTARAAALSEDAARAHAETEAEQTRAKAEAARAEIAEAAVVAVETRLREIERKRVAERIETEREREAERAEIERRRAAEDAETERERAAERAESERERTAARVEREALRRQAERLGRAVADLTELAELGRADAAASEPDDVAGRIAACVTAVRTQIAQANARADAARNESAAARAGAERLRTALLAAEKERDALRRLEGRRQSMLRLLDEPPGVPAGRQLWDAVPAPETTSNANASNSTTSSP